MNMYTIRSFSRAILHGSKFVYQTVPRMLTIWLDLGEDKNLCLHDPFRKMTADISRAMKDAPVYKVRLVHLCGMLGSFWRNI